MKPKPNDKVKVRSFALPTELVTVKLKKRFVPKKNQWGAKGWTAVLVYKKDVNKLIKAGVPYTKNTKPSVWVFDFHIVEKEKK